MGVSVEMAVFRSPPASGWFMEEAENTCMGKGLFGKGMSPESNSKEERVEVLEWEFSEG